ncbi:MAG: class I SAM-dependent methyltransferase [Tissierellia bacterium]|nr:class I SAM-dependent methyltransferase [Tissierellia bacterium]
MSKDKNNFLFNLIAPIYGLFYNYQKGKFFETIEIAKEVIDLFSYKTILDIGSGTGALCSVLNDKGFEVTGIDPAIKMLNIARHKPENNGIKFLQEDVLKGLSFNDKSFEIVISSFVAHGLKEDERRQMYLEMKRVAKNYVIIHDYNKNRALLTNIVEWLEGGDYFNFIKNVEFELRDCFSEVQIIQVDERASWYICKSN